MQGIGAGSKGNAELAISFATGGCDDGRRSLQGYGEVGLGKGLIGAGGGLLLDGAGWPNRGDSLDATVWWAL